MARNRTVEPAEVVAAMRGENKLYASEVARKFGISRVRVSQILAEHAPDLLSTRARPKVTSADTKAQAKRQSTMVSATKKALKANPTHVAAAAALGLTASGLYSRMRRLNIEA